MTRRKPIARIGNVDYTWEAYLKRWKSNRPSRATWRSYMHDWRYALLLQDGFHPDEAGFARNVRYARGNEFYKKRLERRALVREVKKHHSTWSREEALEEVWRIVKMSEKEAIEEGIYNIYKKWLETYIWAWDDLS